MSYAVRDPCRIVNSDSEDEKDRQLRSPMPFTTRPATPKTITKPPAPRLVDWNAPANVPQTDLAPSTQISFTSTSSGSISGAPNIQDSLVSPVTSESSAVLSTEVNPSNFDPIALMQEDLHTFVNTPAPKDYPLFVQCRLKRDKDGVQGGLFPTFYLHAERSTDKKKFFLLAARKVAKVNRQSEYLITTNVETLFDKSGGDGYVGKLRGNNLSGTEYILCSNGLSPNKSARHKRSNNQEDFRRELAGIVYNTNILGLKGPRQITVMLPELGHDIRPKKNEDSILHQWKNRHLSYLIQLRNKTPKYNEDTKTYLLLFTGNRVSQPSVKNFQMVIETANHEEEVIMQFGRVDEDTFTCDYRYPLSAIQAFGIGLSSFDGRLARE